MHNWWADLDSQGREMTPHISGTSLRKTSYSCTTCWACGGCAFCGVNRTSAGDDQKYHDPWIQLFQAQAQEVSWHFPQTHTHWLANFMDSFKISLDSRTPMEGTIPTMPHHLHCVNQKEQPGGFNHFWYFYLLHTMGIRVHLFHKPLFWSLHAVQTPR